MDVITVNHEELVEEIVAAYESKVPLFVWGRTGIGKSQSIKAAGKKLAERYRRKFTTRLSEIDGEHFFVLDRRLTYMNPTDLVGVLYKANGLSKWHPPDWLYAVSKQREEEEGVEVAGIVALEELNLAPTLVQNAAYELVLDRRVHDLEIADGVAFVAAGNTAEDRAFTFEMPDPLKTRFAHVELAVPSFDAWSRWAVENSVDGRILSFLSFRHDLLFKYIEDARTFPTPRGWEVASKLMRNLNDSSAWKAVAKACGMAAGDQFRQFMELARKIDLDTLLEDPTKFHELSVEHKFAAIAAMSSAFRAKPELGTKLLRFAASLVSGVTDEEGLSTYCSLAKKLYDEKDEESARKMREMSGKRSVEFAVLLLSNMASENRQALKKLIAESKYGYAVLDVLRFLA